MQEDELMINQSSAWKETERQLNAQFDADDAALRIYKDDPPLDVSIEAYRQHCDALQRAVVTSSNACYEHLRMRQQHTR